MGRRSHFVLSLALEFLASSGTLCQAQQDAPSNPALPKGAVPTISASLGRDDAAYRAHRLVHGYRIENPRHNLVATFTSSSVSISTGQQSFAFHLSGWGSGNATDALPKAQPTATNNRIEYRRGSLTEWYVNGPAGLEQGFTLNAPPVRRSGGKLQIALDSSGDLQPVLDSRTNSLALRRRNGTTALQYGGLEAHDADGRSLPASMELHKNSLRLLVDDRDAHYPVVVDPLFQVAVLSSSKPKTGDFFGTSVAVSGDGNTIVVSAAGTPFTGAEYVFEKQGALWTTMTEVRRLIGLGTGNLAGEQISISSNGDTILAGETFGGPNQSGLIFVRPGASWSGSGDLTPDARLSIGNFSEGRLALSGDGSTAVVGVPGNRGGVLVFLRGDAWTGIVSPSATLLPSDDIPNIFEVGETVGISEAAGTIVAGGFFEPADEVGIGRVWVFLQPPDGWDDETEAAILGSDDSINNDDFAQSLTISSDGTTVVVGARNTTANHPFQGKAYVFTSDDSNWVTTGTPNATLFDGQGQSGDDFAGSVAVSGNGAHILIGAPSQLRVSEFDRPLLGWGGTFSSPVTLLPNDSVDDFEFGTAESLSKDGSVAVLGGESFSHPGEAYVFTPCISLSPKSFDFGNIIVGATSTPETFTLTNSCENPVGNIEATFSGLNSDEFSQTNTCSGVVFGNTSCDINVVFSPVAVSSLSELAELDVTNDDSSSSPQTANLDGTGVCGVTLSPGSFDFGTINVGSSSSSQNFQLSNQCDAFVTGVAISFSGANAADFSSTDTCGGSIPPTNFCTISVTFTPSTGAAENATLSVAENDPSSPQQATLTGTGLGSSDFSIAPTAASPPSTSGSTSSATVVAGASASYTLTLIAKAGFNSAVTLSAAFTGSSEPDGASLSISSPITPTTSGVVSTLVITTTKRSLAPPMGIRRPWNPMMLVTLILTAVMTILMLFQARFLRRYRPIAFAIVALAVLVALPACQTVTTPPGGSAAGTYQVLVTSNGGGITHTTSVTLIVQ